jgi:predicted secreted protein
MQMKIKTLLLASFVILFQSTLCDTMQALDKFAGEEMVIVQKEQSGQAITVKAGDIIQIELAEVGSAGYRWYIDNLDARYLELVSEETKKVSEKGKIGAPVMRVWRFKAKKVGQTEIKMDYYRKWEGVDKSTNNFFIKINIIKN